MPQFMDHLHYRIVDVSTVKELCRLVEKENYAAANSLSVLESSDLGSRALS